MKKFYFIIILIFCLFCFSSCKNENQDVLRFHIRANSNSSFDQYVKYCVKDNIINLLSSLLDKMESFNQAYTFLSSSTILIEEYSNYILKKNNCNYLASVKLDKEFFDQKYAEDFSMKAGYYNALIINLGEAKGNNWWGLVYPSLSYVSSNGVVDYQNIIYKSKLLDIYEKISG